MTEENKEDSGLQEFEAKVPAQANNKDLWLFLIIVDVVCLCVFGVFLYKNLSARLLAPETSARPVLTAQAEGDALPVQEMDAPVVSEEPAKPRADEPQTPAVQAAPAEPAPAVPVPPAVSEQSEEKAAPAEKKDNILVKTNPRSKYRQVTFRYYGEGENVAVVSGFTMAKPRSLKKKNGYWETTLAIAPGTYKYLYVVDGKNTLDPYADTKDGRSVLILK